jgi:hypothetical protein
MHRIHTGNSNVGAHELMGALGPGAEFHTRNCDDGPAHNGSVLLRTSL